MPTHVYLLVLLNPQLIDAHSFNIVAIIWIAIGVGVLPLTLFVTAPFGRHASQKFGPQFANRLGWILMESPAIWFFSWVFFSGVHAGTPAAWFLWGLWMVHYLHRGVIYPIRIRTRGKQMPVLVIAMAFFFQIVNGYLNGVALSSLGLKYTSSWFSQPVFWIGLMLFATGVAVNLKADNTLLNLRKHGETGYRIPQGRLFDKISCPNFLGEIVQWTGWAVMCWNLAAVSFAVWTFANLVPRALAHHRWYQQNLDEYPSERKAIFPGLL